MAEPIYSSSITEAWLHRARTHLHACALDPHCAKVDCGHAAESGELHVVLGPRPELLCTECFARRALGPQPAVIFPETCLRCGTEPGTQMMTSLAVGADDWYYEHARVCPGCRVVLAGELAAAVTG